MSTDETLIEGDGQGTGAFDPTVVQDDTLGPSQLDRQIVDAAIKRGLITELQGNMVLETVMSEVASGVASGAEATLSVLVGRGLISKEKADELLDSLSEDFVPGFKLGRELGRGAMGVVYEATQKRLDRRVALKVVNPNLSANPGYVKRFKREALTLAKLNHPNIVQVYDYGEVDGRIYLALEFVEGEDVAELMKREGALPEGTAIRIARDAALGLSHAHHHGVIHRDIKPANLLLLQASLDASGKRFSAKVTDLGLAREAEPQGAGELTAAGTILGTPAYMAPEQTEGELADYRADIYALGASLYHMLTAKVPYADSSVVNMLIKKRTERLPNPQAIVPGLSAGIVRVIDRMMARAPGVRYQDYEELIADLDQVLVREPPGTPPVPFDQSSLDLTGLSDTLVAGSAAPTDRYAAVTERPPSGRLGDAGPGTGRPGTGRPGTGRPGTGRPGTGRPGTGSPGTGHLSPEGLESEEAEGAPAQRGSIVPLVLVLLVAAGLTAAAIVQGIGSSSSGSPSPSPSASPSASPSVGPTPPPPSLAGKVEAALAALSALPARQQLAQDEALAALARDVAALPEAERPALKIKLQALVGKALDEAGEEALAEARGSWERGNYPQLQNRVEKLRIAHELASREPGQGLAQLGERAAAAAKDGQGAAERKLWGEIEATWTQPDRGDELALLGKLEALRRDYAAFSPVLAEADRRRAELERRNPLLQVRAVPDTATLSIDGVARGAGPFAGRLPLGRHVLVLTAEGHRELRHELDLQGPRTETVHLSPQAPRALRADADFLTRLDRNPGNKVQLRTFGRALFKPGRLTADWECDGGWNPELAYAGASGQGLPDDYRVARRRSAPEFLPWLRTQGAAGWSISWKMQPWAGTETKDGKTTVKRVPAADVARGGAEGRFLAHGEREVVVGYDRGQVYVGLRGPQGLEVLRSEPYTGLPPDAYQVDWDADSALVEVYVGRERGNPRFFHAIRLSGTPSEGVAFAATRTEALFSGISLWARVVPE